MASPKSSWRLKLDRAEHHLNDLDGEVTRYASTNPYMAVREPVCQIHENCWLFTLQIREQPDPAVAMIAGDAVHNLRSALDHLAVAIAPKKYARIAAFPVALEDIDVLSPDNEARKGFYKALDGMDPKAVALIKGYQPYWESNDIDRRRHGLAVVNTLDNADKHRQLMLISSGLTSAGSTTTVRGQSISQLHAPDGFAVNGTQLSHFAEFVPPLQESEVQVEIRGTPAITVDIGLKDAELELTSLYKMAEAIRDEVFPALEPFIRK